MPYAVGLIVAYAKKQMPWAFDFEIYKSPDEFAAALDGAIPDVVCFSNFIWNSDLNYELARRIKARRPETVIVFGGPNYPIMPSEQKDYLTERPVIDFYIYKDGEEVGRAGVYGLQPTADDWFNVLRFLT